MFRAMLDVWSEECRARGIAEWKRRVGAVALAVVFAVLWIYRQFVSDEQRMRMAEKLDEISQDHDGSLRRRMLEHPEFAHMRPAMRNEAWFDAYAAPHDPDAPKEPAQN